MTDNARLLVPEIVAATGRWPRSVLEIGLPDSELLHWWMTIGATDLAGASDYHSVPEREFELACCLDIPDMLSAEEHSGLVEALTKRAPRVVFCARDLPHWAELFEAQGYVCQDILRHRLAAAVSPELHAGLVLFARQGHEVKYPKACLCLPWYRTPPEDLVDVKNRLMFMGWPVNQLRHQACIDKGRSELASNFIRDPEFADCEWSVWIDDDNTPTTQQVIDLVVAAQGSGWDVCTALYVTKEVGGRIVHRLPGNVSGAVAVGPYARPHRVDGCGFGCVAVHRSVFERMQAVTEAVWFGPGDFGCDFFRPQLGESDWDRIDLERGVATRAYEGEDFSWAINARRLGIEIWVHPMFVVEHQGNYRFGAKDIRRQANGT